MRGDLRRLLGRLRAGVIEDAVMLEALEEACRSLVTLRFESMSNAIETSSFARPLLSRFEAAVSRARLLAREGELRAAVHGVESAGAALEAARQCELGERELNRARAAWASLRARFDLGSFGDLATVRECERVLAIAESFLAGQAPRKAQFVLRQCRSTLDGLGTSRFEPARRRVLIERLEALRASPRPPERLLEALGRMVEEGPVELAQRLLADWEMTDPGGSSDVYAALERRIEPIREAGREAASLLGELVRLAPEERSRGGPRGDRLREAGS